MSKSKCKLLTVKQDAILMRMHGDASADEPGTSSAPTEKISYIVNPNCDIEGMGIHEA